MAGGNVFLSYRRDDSEGHAGRLYDRLSARFPNQIFRDVKDLEPGVDFVDEIERKLASCSVMVLLIGPRWLSLTDATGARRIDQAADLHRLEIVTALQRKVRVIPALVGGAAMPSAEALPAELAFLARRQALPLSEVDFDHDMSRLIGVLEKELGEAGRSEPIHDTRAAGPERPAPLAPPVAQAAPPAPRPRRLRWMVAGGAVAVVLLALAGLATSRNGSQAPPPPAPAPAPVAASGPPPETAPPARPAAPKPAPEPEAPRRHVVRPRQASAAPVPPLAAAPVEIPPPATTAPVSAPPPSPSPITSPLPARPVIPPPPVVPARALDIAWSDGTVELAGLVRRLSRDEQTALAVVVLAARAQGGDVYAIHVWARNTGRTTALVMPQQLSLHLGSLTTQLTAVQRGGFFRGGQLMPGQVVEGILMFPATNAAGMAIRAGGGELHYADASVATSISRRR